MTKKPWYKSKSIWSAVGKVVVGLYAMLSPELQGQVGEAAGAGLVVVGILDGILRSITSKPLSS